MGEHLFKRLAVVAVLIFVSGTLSDAWAGPRSARGWPGVWPTAAPPLPQQPESAPQPSTAQQQPPPAWRDPSEPLINELRFGVLHHDAGVFGRNEEDGIDLNGEVLFRAPRGRFWEFIFSPRPQLGVTINTEGDTSQIYGGLTWRIEGRLPIFLDLSLGGSVHDGELKTDEKGSKELGSRVLFREAVELGYRLTRNHTISVMLDHVSNANLADKNEGLETFGIRYSYRR